MQAATAFAGVGCAAALWPFIDQSNPNAGTPLPETRDVELASVNPGETKTVEWRGQPIAIRHRTSDELRLARSVAVQDLPDRAARNHALAKSALASDGCTRASRLTPNRVARERGAKVADTEFIPARWQRGWLGARINHWRRRIWDDARAKIVARGAVEG